VDISFDIAEKEKFNNLRGSANAYDWVMQTIKICAENNIKTTLVTILVDKTVQVDNLSKILELSRSHGCFLRLNIFRPNAGQEMSPVRYSVVKSTLLWIIDYASVVSLCDPLFSAILTDKRSTDNSGTSSLRILPDGSITPSTYLVTDQWIYGNIKEGVSLKQNPFNIIMEDIDLNNNIPKDCSKCRVVDKCMGGAMDRRIIWHNTLSKRDPYCPFENKDNLDSWGNKKIEYKDGPCIHDGYLPTLIFKP
ncbi:MAG: SPASM domain-containing protein, partial [Bacteroidales bacterium]|jgi:radical SAM protein with 4Fe4S-binding SPASM domain|nr:SPASM domain-containing protein [Bacteroidales bacterium]